jgi:hypothetical protein
MWKPTTIYNLNVINMIINFLLLHNCIELNVQLFAKEPWSQMTVLCFIFSNFHQSNESMVSWFLVGTKAHFVNQISMYYSSQKRFQHFSTYIWRRSSCYKMVWRKKLEEEKKKGQLGLAIHNGTQCKTLKTVVLRASTPVLSVWLQTVNLLWKSPNVSV